MNYPIASPLYIMPNGTLLCCKRACGVLVPLAANGAYGGPNCDGKTFITFNLFASPVCGIPIARVLRGDLEGLVGRDELAELNPSSGSMRLRIKVSNHSPAYPFRELTHAESGTATSKYHQRSSIRMKPCILYLRSTHLR
jgi:hypothetical protein